jgi:glutathione S-transferase
MASALPAKPIQFYDLQPAPGICPFAQRSKVVLKEKGLPYEQILIDAQNKPQDFLDLSRSITSNPNHRGTVPAIVDGDVKLNESHVVSEYLDAAYPEAGTKLFPTDSKKLGKVKLFVELYTSEAQPFNYKALGASTQEEVDEAIKGFLNGYKILDGFLKDHGEAGGDFLLGSEFSYAEAATLPFSYRAFLTIPAFRNVDLWKLLEDNSLQRVTKWLKAGFARPSVKETLAPDEVTLNLFKARFVKDLK